MIKKLSCGTQRKDGKVFWHYFANGSEYWVSPEKFHDLKFKKSKREKEYEAINKEKIAARKAEYYKKNREKILNQTRLYEQLNRKKVNERKRKYQYNRRKTNFKYALSCRLRWRFNTALRKRKFTKKSKVYQMVGCDWETLKHHIESQFRDGMGWHNFNQIHIDHIIPISSANTEEEMAALFHYKNLRPLWGHENLKKGAKIEQQ
jgi:hypothetical protein